MTTPQPPRNDDAPDGRVAASLWRLRARLVTPPDAQRARSDLDQIMAAAREHAHDAPLAGATATPHRHPDVEVEAGATVRALTPRTDAQRAPARWMRVSRVAAVTVLIVGVGGGIASAVSGEGGLLLRLQTPDGDVATAAPASDASAGDADATDATPDGDGTPAADGDDVLAADGAAGDANGDVEVVPGGEDGASDAGADDGGAADSGSGADGDSVSAGSADGSDGAADDGAGAGDDASNGVGAPGGSSSPSGSSGGSSGGSSTGSSGGSSGDAPSSDPDAGVGADGADGATDGDGSNDASDGSGSTDGDAPEDTIVALPEPPSEPGSVDGFGGAAPCPDGASSCLPGGEEPAAGATDTDGSDEASDDDVVTAPVVVTEDPRPDDDDADESLDDLAARRAGN